MRYVITTKAPGKRAATKYYTRPIKDSNCLVSFVSAEDARAWIKNVLRKEFKSYVLNITPIDDVYTFSELVLGLPVVIVRDEYPSGKHVRSSPRNNIRP